MQNCTIKAADDLRQENFKFKTFLGRPWGNLSRTIIMQSYLDDIIDPKGWLEWNGRSPDRVYYAEYKNEGPGANTGGRVPWEKVINSSIEATNFTLRNFIEGDKWIPATASYDMKTFSRTIIMQSFLDGHSLDKVYYAQIMSSRPEFKSSGRRGYNLSNEFSTSKIYSHLAFFLSFLLGVYKASKELLPTKFQRSALIFVEIIKQHKHQLCINRCWRVQNSLAWLGKLLAEGLCTPED
ncbi:hypothetical protein ACSBR1_029607 [Camellia fascicularis]